MTMRPNDAPQRTRSEESTGWTDKTCELDPGVVFVARALARMEEVLCGPIVRELEALAGPAAIGTAAA